jgi:hypothetical protein
VIIPSHTSVRQPIAVAVLLGDAKARYKLDKRLSIKIIATKTIFTYTCIFYKKATSDNSLVGQGDDDTCLSKFSEVCTSPSQHT